MTYIKSRLTRTSGSIHCVRESAQGKSEYTPLDISCRNEGRKMRLVGNYMN